MVHGCPNHAATDVHFLCRNPKGEWVKSTYKVPVCSRHEGEDVVIIQRSSGRLEANFGF